MPPSEPLFNRAFIRKLKHWIATHHTVYPHLPPQGIYFESLVDRAFLHSGWARDQVILRAFGNNELLAREQLVNASS
jgi:hypothetical protein